MLGCQNNSSNRCDSTKKAWVFLWWLIHWWWSLNMGVQVRWYLPSVKGMFHPYYCHAHQSKHLYLACLFPLIHSLDLEPIFNQKWRNCPHLGFQWASVLLLTTRNHWIPSVVFDSSQQHVNSSVHSAVYHTSKATKYDLVVILWLWTLRMLQSWLSVQIPKKHHAYILICY